MTSNPSLHREENIKTLVSLGITGTQAKICLALARIGVATISEIADAAEVARPDTYRAAVELEKKGLLEKIVSTPARYELASFARSFSYINRAERIRKSRITRKDSQLAQGI